MCAFADEESGMPPVLLRGAVAVLTALAHNLGSWGMATRVECEYVKSQHTTRKLVQTKCAAATACAVSYGLFVDEVCDCWRFISSLLAAYFLTIACQLQRTCSPPGFANAGKVNFCNPVRRSALAITSFQCVPCL